MRLTRGGGALDTARIEVSRIPRGQAATIRELGAATVDVALCRGHVHLEGMTLQSGRIMLRQIQSSVRDCTNVTLSSCAIPSGGLEVRGSTVAMTGCRIGGLRSQNGLALAPLQIHAASRVWFAEGQCTAGSTLPIFPTPAIDLNGGSRLFVAGDATTSLTPTTGQPAVRTLDAASSVLVDPNVRLPSRRHAGAGSFRVAPIPSLLAWYPNANQLVTRVHAPGAKSVLTLSSLSANTPLPLGALGDAYVTFTNFVIDAGAIGVGGIRRATTRIPVGLLRGVPAVAQGLVIYPNALRLTAPAPTSIGR